MKRGRKGNGTERVLMEYVTEKLNMNIKAKAILDATYCERQLSTSGQGCFGCGRTGT
jgi:hypothetical protein